ncbi:hypothetical protein E3T34_02155 [Cryobacterium sp. TMT1-62]|uniref:hypothetical protein n=1 Tax=unclassified Cryobacterium TaxID=2649013 RepID=UPI000CE39DCF|nr:MULTISPECIES: hypothetical protein [unclassified Cryobacterium]TFB57289.1 hypothetical protein E3N94_05485 [Cryobacterium sp. Sr3]TFC48416.1 hypothetical protein E3O47_14005 [Cryobacterium sp. TMT2-17-1]TFC64300.1 hypothetical protein E3O54_15075 [Cryobacterium sp. TMT2-4]TFD35880.1 hypothetical protein E3T34_02155 [Cryobacterium sp. TMT1-62]
MDYSATIVAQTHVTKPDALRLIAEAAGSTVRNAGTAHPFVPLVGGGRVEVEIPKFGEGPPLAIDVFNPHGAEQARASALSLQAALASVTDWPTEVR